MHDLISRQAAIDYFLVNVGFHDEDGIPIEDSDELRKIWTEYFNGIPSAQQWIPCSEEPPEEGEDVLVTRRFLGVKDCKGLKPKTYVEIAKRDDEVWMADSDDCKIAPHLHTDPIAWMPLPDPYRKEGDDE